MRRKAARIHLLPTAMLSTIYAVSCCTRIVAAAVSKSIDARKRTARRSEHGSQKLPLRSVLLYLSQNAVASQVVRLAMKSLPLTSLKPNAPHSTSDAADSTKKVGHVSSFHARGGGPNGGNR